MDFLFLHQNFPGQFAHLAPRLAQMNHRVTALTSRVTERTDWRGVNVVPYPYEPPKDQRHHPWLMTLNGHVDRGTAVLRAALDLKAQGYSPRAIVAHPGWGEALFLRDVWPDARIGLFCEFFYQADGADVDFDPEFVSQGELGREQRIRLKNLPGRMQMEIADAGISPTRWQASSYPAPLRDKITVAFDGIDTLEIAPDAEARLTLGGRTWSRADEVVTFVNRNLEPYRGFHVFMRALPDLLTRRPDAQVIVVGDDGVSYGAAPKEGRTWREVLSAEIAGRMSPEDWARVHFVGRVSRQDFTRVLQVSRVHLYLTYPFVLSWSLIEAMACECAIVASGTAPVREAIADGETGLLFDFFDGGAMVDAVCRLLEDGTLRHRLGRAARAHVVETYDLQRVCLPAQIEWLRSFVE